MLNYSKLVTGVASAALSLVPCFAQRATLEIDKVSNWPAPLYWQHPVPSGQDNANGRTTSAQEPQQVGSGAQLRVAAVFVAITPCRLADSRSGSGFGGNFGPPSLAAGETRVYPVPSGSCSLPAAAVAYSFNIAVVPAGSTMRWLTAWPDGETMPVLATLNDKAGVVTSNAAIVAAGNNGAIDIYVEDATDVILDVNGYYALPGSLPMSGTAAAPALTFGDTTTGLYSTVGGSVSIAAEGNTAATVNSTGLSVPGNLDFGGIITQSGGALLRSSAGTSSISLGPGAGGSLASVANSAFGMEALYSNTTGVGNTALGAQALLKNLTANYNTAVGYNALESNTTGYQNTAVGLEALVRNITGADNVAVGEEALDQNISGNGNSAFGVQALTNNTTGLGNTAAGEGALVSNNTGAANTAIGLGAGELLTTGSNNIDIGYGANGISGEDSTVRVGGQGIQNRTFISGISGTTTGLSGALPVVIDSHGQLGTVSSSRRAKTDIADMGDTTETLMSLRPVQFRYTAYGAGAPLQYGLIAEEVAEVAPELVAHNAKGEIETVYYDKVNAMLLNQVQTQQREIESQKTQFQSQLESQREQFQSRLQSQSEQFTGLISQLESRLAELESRAK
ncbi:MAG: tail fiber domain-containing protein [Bryobacteraceae bacterium]